MDEKTDHPTPKPKRDDFPMPAHLRMQAVEETFYLTKFLKSADMRRASLLWRCLELLFAAATGSLFALAFPAFDWHLLGWVGLVPLLFLTVGMTPRRAFFNAYVWGYFWALFSFGWFREIGLFFPLFAAFVLAFFPAVWGLCIPFLHRHIVVPFEMRREGFEAEQVALLKPKAWREIVFMFAAAMLWVTLEWVRSWIGTGLPWNTLATTQWQNVPLLQVCAYTGFYGISFAVALMNVGIYFVCRNAWRLLTLGIYSRLWPALTAAVFVAFVVITSNREASEAARPNPEQIREGELQVRAGMVQSNNPVAWGKPMDNLQRQLDNLINHSVTLAVSENPDFIVWPETAMPWRYSRHAVYQRAIANLSHAVKRPLIIGSPEVMPDDPEKHVNAALLFDKHGTIVDRYHKYHIVPFGEYIPFGALLDRAFPELREQFALPLDLTPGTQLRPLEPVAGVRAGINICFEDVFPYVSREFVRNGANLLVTITNDAWYPESSERAQHLANSVFRAVENRRFLVRTGNMTRACLIDPAGVVVRWFDQAPGVGFDPMQCANGAVCFEFGVPRNPSFTFYTRYGDIFAYLCATAAFLFLFGAAWQWRRLRTFVKERRQPSMTDTEEN